MRWDLDAFELLDRKRQGRNPLKDQEQTACEPEHSGGTRPKLHMRRRLKKDRPYRQLDCPCRTDRKAMALFKEQSKRNGRCSCWTNPRHNGYFKGHGPADDPGATLRW